MSWCHHAWPPECLRPARHARQSGTHTPTRTCLALAHGGQGTLIKQVLSRQLFASRCSMQAHCECTRADPRRTTCQPPSYISDISLGWCGVSQDCGCGCGAQVESKRLVEHGAGRHRQPRLRPRQAWSKQSAKRCPAQVDGEHVVRRTGYHLVPFLFMTALLTYLDRGALSFAAPSLNTVLTRKTSSACRSASATCQVAPLQ